MSALLTQSPDDTVWTGTGKVDPACKFKCTKAARAPISFPVKINQVRVNGEINYVYFGQRWVPQLAHIILYYEDINLKMICYCCFLVEAKV